MVTNEENFPKLERLSPELIASKSATCLELEIECCTIATQDCEVFVELEIAPLETVPQTEKLMQTEILKGTIDFRTNHFFVLKDKSLFFATYDEFKELIKLTTILEGKMEQETETALSRFLCNELEKVVTGGELTHAGSGE